MRMALILAGLLLLPGCTQTFVVEPKGGSAALPGHLGDSGMQAAQSGYEIPLSDEMRQEIENAWLDKEGYSFSWERGNNRYYGTYGDCAVFYHRGEIAASVISEITVADSVFTSGSAFGIYVYHDGQFRSLQDAYESGLLTKEQIGEIAEYHANYRT